MKAIGMHIFCGSQTIGHLLEGWKIDTVLEISEDMPNQNAYHFIKNYPKISVKKPSEYTKVMKHILTNLNQRIMIFYILILLVLVCLR